MPSSVCPNSVCFGNISVLDSNSKINKSLSKKFLITVALVFSFKKTYKCKPPLFDFTGMIGNFFSTIVFKYYLKLKFL